jgi:hypothetical protein
MIQVGGFKGNLQQPLSPSKPLKDPFVKSGNIAYSPHQLSKFVSSILQWAATLSQFRAEKQMLITLCLLLRMTK